jgi:hypothetical protein
MRFLRLPSRLAATLRASGIDSVLATLSLASLAGCTGLFDIPDDPRLVSAPDASMPGIRVEPPPLDGSLPPTTSTPAEPSSEVTPPPPLDTVMTGDTPGRNIEDERSDAGAPSADAAVPPPDASPVPPPPTPACAEPAVLGPNGRCFALTSTLLSWADARQECQSRGPGWDLASIQDGAVNEFMGDLQAGEAWIGASDADEEGLWVWVSDGTPFWDGDGTTGNAVGSAFENWNSNEPNGRNNSACARLVFTTNDAPNPPPAWADLECFELLPSVCDGPQL